MKKTLKSQVDTFTAFEKFCNDNQSIWNGTVAFGDGVTALGVKTQSIISTESQQEENNKGITRTKSERKMDMANEAVAVAHALQAYAISVEDSTLYELMSVVYSTIMKSKDSAAIASCELVYDTAHGLAPAAILPFGISAAVLTTLQQTITEFKGTAPATRNVVTHKTVLTNNCMELVSEANTIMRDQLLKLGRQFKKTHPDFYEGLVANAKVIYTSVHAKIRIKLFDDVTSKPLANAQVTVSGTELMGTSNAKGECTVNRVPAGKREVSISLEKYIGMTLTINFQRGHSVTRTVEMAPAFDIPALKETVKEKVK